jgi:hypothetical protein
MSYESADVSRVQPYQAKKYVPTQSPLSKMATASIRGKKERNEKKILSSTQLNLSYLTSLFFSKKSLYVPLPPPLFPPFLFDIKM